METPVGVSIQCAVCRQFIRIQTTVESLARRDSGMKVQDAFPDLSRNEREMFTGSRTCSKCYDQLFPEEEEESEEEEELDDFNEFLNTLGIHEVITIDIGSRVLCDTCNKEYTPDDGIKGGLLFNRHACCPDCAPRMREIANDCDENHFITNPREDETFYNFVMRMR